jgi:SAM-dependent methyltransferase
MSEAFDDLCDAYEAMIDWPRRLANEGPFFRAVFESISCRRVLDAACGTGHHAAMFHSWGLSVEGADVSQHMIQRCRQRHGESNALRWTVRGFDEPVASGERFDAAICIGNSLALASDAGRAGAAVGHMLQAVRPGGLVVVHVLNLWKLPDGAIAWQKCLRASLPQGDCLVTKGVHRCGSAGFVDMLVTRLDVSPPALRAECVPFLGLGADDLRRFAADGGAAAVEVWGGYQRQPYNPTDSTDLILVARR